MDEPRQTVTVSVRMPQYLADELRRASHSERRKLSQFIRNLLIDWYTERKTDDPTQSS